MTKGNDRMQQFRFQLHRIGRRAAGLALALLCGSALAADAPALFELNYDARYGSWRAESVRSLTQQERDGVYHMQAQSKVLLLGKSVSTITEDATFAWQDGLPLTSSYRYTQTGIGARTRSVEFDRAAGIARWQVKDKRGETPLQGPVFDELTSFLVLRQRLAQGERDIVFDVMDRDHVESHHYRVVSEEPLHTPLGDFAAVHVARIREEGSKRSTEFWLASDHDYVLLKLEQTEPDARSISLEITDGTVNGQALQGLPETHMNELEQDERDAAVR